MEKNAPATEIYCSGAILSGVSVITAAHCLSDQDYKGLEVLVGEHDLAKADGEERYSICSILVHPQYDR